MKAKDAAKCQKGRRHYPQYYTTILLSLESYTQQQICQTTGWIKLLGSKEVELLFAVG